ncbi:hypothetical protein FA15DRAFT_587870 [Coprinopsis marcescibilis]|uniref:Thc1 RRM domain-containing protein n=1 Tax=Coprinopsis marcescibilis TaxID=230819 RepID=A0A5C3L268_COPMA|nr:hypothetical protein FA15DRAFT_587870 [Coprinopsis marcescibilis]
MASSLSGLSASVTRILSLTGFPKELKTKDIQVAFSEYEHSNGGFKIKWKDDTSLLIVFNDATVAKRAYLQTIAYPPPALSSATIKPYDGPDAQTIIQAVNSRLQHHSTASRSHNVRAASISVIPGVRTNPGSSNHANSRNSVNTSGASISIPEHPSANGREPSPTLPSLPAQPTLNSLISSSLGESALVHADPAILTTSLQAELSNGPRIGDPGKRMLGAALGVRHPALGPRMLNGNGNGNGIPGSGPHGDLARAMNGLVIAE